jgi:hypothetical protein
MAKSQANDPVEELKQAFRSDKAVVVRQILCRPPPRPKEASLPPGSCKTHQNLIKCGCSALPGREKRVWTKGQPGYPPLAGPIF